jgi:hypothetical protein
LSKREWTQKIGWENWEKISKFENFGFPPRTRKEELVA